MLNRSSIYSNYVQGAMGILDYTGGNGLGGGIFNAGLLMVTNCTIALNSAIAGSGGRPMSAYEAIMGMRWAAAFITQSTPLRSG